MTKIDKIFFLKQIKCSQITEILGKNKVHGFGASSFLSLLSPAFGILMGGYILEYGSWRWIFFGPLIPGVIAFILALTILPKNLKPSEMKKIKEFDFLGTISLALGTFCFLFAINRGPEYGWTSWIVLLCFIFVPGLKLVSITKLKSQIFSSLCFFQVQRKTSNSSYYAFLFLSF